MTSNDENFRKILRELRSLCKQAMMFFVNRAKKAINNATNPHSPPTKFNTLEGFCRENGLPIHDYEQGIDSHRLTPRSIHAAPHWRFTCDMTGEKSIPKSEEPTFWCSLDNVFVTGNDCVFSNDGTLFSDLSKIRGISIQQHHVFQHGNLPEPERVKGTTLILENSSSGNIFHFLFDTLGRLALIPNNIIPDHLYIENSASFEKQYLDILGFSEKLIIPPSNKVYSLETAILPAITRNQGFSNAKAIKFLRKIKVKIDLGKPLSGKKIYISREDAKTRMLENEEEIQHHLRLEGFEVVIMAGKSVLEQINIFSNASVIVAPHGAALTNLIYCDPGTKVIELFSPKYVNPCYWSICNICNLDYFYLVGEGETSYEKNCLPFVRENIRLHWVDLEKSLSLSGIQS